MKCYYELLGVPQNVEATDLKKAYYKLSLQWHPDKNTKEDTTIIFQEIQEAYKVLSDPHERAWYDKHRAQILQRDGCASQMGGTSNYQEDRVDVFQYFTRSCFEKFDDGPKGFYTVYGKVFADIAKEEKHAAAFSGHVISSSESDTDDNDDGSCGSKPRSYPPFGVSSSSYTEVVAPFYLFWETFETKKTYTWVEKYDTRCADSRQERRAMEAENSRLRMAAIRKRNEEIHQLVAYVKKRDKRVLAEKERIQRATEAAKARTQSMAVKARQREAAQLAEAWNDEMAFGGIASQWSEQFEAELARMEAELDGTVQKNSRSKQHCDDGDNPREPEDVDENAGDSVDTAGSDNDEESNEIDELYCIACDKLFASLKAKQNHESSKKHRKQLELLRKVISEEDSVLQEHLNSVIKLENLRLNDNNDDDADADGLSTSQQPTVKLTKRAKKAERKRKKEAEAEKSSVVNINEASHTVGEETVEVIDSTESVDNADNSESDAVTKVPVLNNPTSHPDDNTTPLPNTIVNQSAKESRKLKSTSSKVSSTICDICSVDFNSRNALFNHLRESGHARLKSTVNTVQNSNDESKKTKCKGKSKHKH
ncbi:unnamed protein product [Trichobilharzia szidati]|nr:unnamed protein product [Trichobilharzia szidati]